MMLSGNQPTLEIIITAPAREHCAFVHKSNVNNMTSGGFVGKIAVSFIIFTYHCQPSEPTTTLGRTRPQTHARATVVFEFILNFEEKGTCGWRKGYRGKALGSSSDDGRIADVMSSFLFLSYLRSALRATAGLTMARVLLQHG